MSYSSQAQLANDSDFRARCVSAASVEVPHTHQPQQWMYDHIWWISAAPGFADKYESALIADPPIDRPGNDPSVISDAEILSAVQALVEDEATP